MQVIMNSVDFPITSKLISFRQPDYYKTIFERSGTNDMTDHGGSFMKEAKLCLVYLGMFWGDINQLEWFAADLMNNGYLSELSVYGCTGPFSKVTSMNGPSLQPGQTVTDSMLQGIVKSIPNRDPHTIYSLILPSGVTVSEQGSSSCSQFCGYHGSTDDGTIYTVQPASDCNGCFIDNPFNGFTMVLAHEIAEALTDAVPGLGWYNDNNGQEVGDECAWNEVSYGPWKVQPYWVNGVGCSNGAWNPTPVPVPPPPPQPQPNGEPTAESIKQALITNYTNLINDLQQLS